METGTGIVLVPSCEIGLEPIVSFFLLEFIFDLLFAGNTRSSPRTSQTTLQSIYHYALSENFKYKE